MDTLRCDGLHKTFGGIWALADFSLQFPPSGVIAIIGPNGSGKTTLVNILSGFLQPDAGRCFLGEHEITRLASHQVAQLGVARTFQELRLIFRTSVLDNILLSRRNRRSDLLLWALLGVGVDVEEAQNQAEALRLLRSVGLDADVNRLAGELSYGQQKLLTLACCIATDARVLLLDEPVAGVHPDMAVRILDLLQELRNDGKLIVFVEHDISAVRQVADHVVVLDHGKIVVQGEPRKVLDQTEIMEAYLG